MNKRHIITIAGDLASGKGTVTELLKRDLGYEIYRNGTYVRNLAKEQGLDINNFQEYLNAHPEIDRQIEESAKNYAKGHDNLIIDARLGWYAVPDSFKVYLSVDLEVAAKRALNDKNRKNTENFSTLEEAKKFLSYRFEEENKRFFNLYNVRKDDMNNYDFVLDTTSLTPEEVNSKIKEEYFKWLEQ